MRIINRVIGETMDEIIESGSELKSYEPNVKGFRGDSFLKIIKRISYFSIRHKICYAQQAGMASTFNMIRLNTKHTI